VHGGRPLLATTPAAEGQEDLEVAVGELGFKELADEAVGLDAVFG